MEEINIVYLEKSLSKLGIESNESTLSLFNNLYKDLIIWNEHTNLTRIIDERDFIDKHLLDSLSCIKIIDKKDTSLKIIDIGTGAGFPLLPLWIVFPHWKITLVDSVKKKLNFIESFYNKHMKPHGYKESNISIIHSRAEDLAKDFVYRDNYDLVISRAVAYLPTLVELCMPFVKVNGTFLAMKSSEVDKELTESKKIISLLGSKVLKVEKFDLLETDLKRSLVSIKKEKATTKDFPRKAGEAKRVPIIN